MGSGMAGHCAQLIRTLSRSEARNMMPETTPLNTQQQKHALAKPDATQPPQSQIHDVVHADKQYVRWSARRRLDAWFLSLILLLGVATLFSLSSGASLRSGPTNV